MLPARALLRHIWAMVQTRAEAAVVVVELQRAALGRGLLLYLVAAVAAAAFIVTVLLLVAFGTPEQYRLLALGLVAVGLLATAIFGTVQAGRQLRRDRSLIAEFTRGLRLDFAMVNLALKDPEPDTPDKLAERERARTAVREAATEKAGAPGTAGDGAMPTPGGPAMGPAAAAMATAAPGVEPGVEAEAEVARAAELPPGATGREMPQTSPESINARQKPGEQRANGSA